MFVQQIARINYTWTQVQQIEVATVKVARLALRNMLCNDDKLNGDEEKRCRFSR